MSIDAEGDGRRGDFSAAALGARRDCVRGEIMENPRREAHGGRERGCELFDLKLYKFAINSLPLGVVVLGPKFKIMEANTWMEKLIGYSRQELLGRLCRDVLQNELCDIRCPLKKVLEDGRSFVQVETALRTRQDAFVPVRVTASALVGEEGQVLGGVEIFQDISDIKALEREKSNLISMFAHDMRSSLTGIHGLGLRLMKKSGEMGEEKRRQFLEIINREAGKLESLVDDFLEFSRLRSGRLEFNFSATSLDRELMEIYEAYQCKATQRRVRLRLQIEDALPIIPADVRRLRRVFTNFLDNALKFSREKGTITIRARETEQEVMVQVMDEGIGIDPDELPYIFDLFHRGRDPSRSEGYGIGLATVKTIVEAHGGRVHVASEPGKGSVFTIFLPKSNRLPSGDLGASGGERESS